MTQMPGTPESAISSASSSIPATFELLAETQRAAIAVQAGARALTYGELDQQANRLAHRLHALGVDRGALVGVLAERGLETIVGMLGALKARAAYVPLDPASPRQRTLQLIDEAQVRVLVAPAHLAPAVHAPELTVIALDPELQALAGEDPTRIGLELDPCDLYAVLFTSGSTGVPKGVALEHRNLLNLVENASALAPLPGEGALHVCAPQFDVAAHEIWATLLGGGRLVCHPPGRPDPRAVCRTVVEHGVTWSSMATGIFHQLVESGPEQLAGLRMLLAGGEVMLPHYARRFRAACPETRLFNTYGPAETTVFACVHEVREDAEHEQPIPIGRAVAGAQLQILDEHLEPVQPGARGELYIGGPGVSRGYLNQPALTNARYLADPTSDNSDARRYRSGDVVRERADGALEILGRVDRQVKVSGYRVEPAEVEANLVAHPAVSNAAVLAHEAVPGQKRLVAYVVLADHRCDPAAVRGFLSERLPPYMVPATIHAIERLPLTANGKVDRAALPDPASLRVQDRPHAHASPSAVQLAGIFAEVLGVPTVDPSEDFFELGGNSLLAVQVLSRLHAQIGVELPLAAVFEARTAHALTELVANAPAALTPGLPALQARAHPHPTPATAGQAKALLITELAEESLPYQSQAVHRILGTLDVGALARALTELVRRHEILRTTFARTRGKWLQHVHEPFSVRLAVADLSAAADPEQALDQHLAEVFALRLDPARLPLARWSLARLKDTDHALIALEHHVVHDGFSTALMLRELTALYTAELAHPTELAHPMELAHPTERAHPGDRARHPAALPDPPIQFRDFASWQAELAESELGRRTLAHWRARLAGAPQALALPLDRPRPPRQTYRGESLRLTLPEPLAQTITQRAHEWGATPFMVMLAAYSALLARYAQAEEVVIGSGLANRRTLASEALIGMVVNTVALRIDLSDEPDARELVTRVRARVLEAQAHQDVPFERVVEHLAPTRSANAPPLYQALFSFHDSQVRTLELPGAVLVPQDARPNGSAKADLSAIVIDRRSEHPVTATVAPESYQSLAEDGLTVVWEYNSDLFERATAQRMLTHYRALLEQLLAADTRPVASLAPSSAEERDRVLAFAGSRGVYERDATIAEVFQARAAATPDAAALRFGDETLSYQQLDRHSNRLAQRLRTLGVERDCRVGVCMERSIEFVTAILAIAKAGGAYVPLDPHDPTERLREHVHALGIPLLLSLARHRDQLPGPAASIVCLDDELDLPRELDSPPPSAAGPLDPAYVMFTSGSTGAPKGVEVPHRAIVRLVRGTDYVDLGPQETLLGLAPAAFDASTFELWGALLNGARLVLAPPGALTLGELADLLARERVSTLWLTAGLFHRAVEDRPELFGSLRQLLAGGDVLSPAHVHRALAALPAGAVLVNGYGPTEATTFTCAHRMQRGAAIDGAVPIGRPISGSRVYILDERREPVPIGIPGELCIGGDGVALGYANDPALTAERFPTDPFASEPGARMYRSGDRARWRADGTIAFLGRHDRQLKIRGFRIEPGEVEEALRAHPNVADALVASFQRTSDERVLAAYVVPRSDTDPSDAELRTHLGRILPTYAVPAAWARLERLPLTTNGKLDSAALPPPRIGVARTARGDGHAHTPDGEHAPDELERQLMAIWRRALELDQIDRDDDFFDLGGHSLLAVEVFDAIERALGLQLPLASIFDAPTVRRLAASLRDEGWRHSRGSLIVLTPPAPNPPAAPNSQPPLFFVSAGDGNSVGFGALARRLGPDQPFYGLAPRGLNGGAPLHSSVEAMAAHYVRAIRRAHPHGPYLLGGRCLGGMVAYEMARQLAARGAEVGLLAVLDSGGPLWQARPLADGTPYDEIMHSALRHASDDVELDDVFSPAGTARLLRWLSEPVLLGADGTPINRYLHEVYRRRSDVRDAYPDLAGEHALWFVGWAWTTGREQLGLTEQLLPPAANPQWQAPRPRAPGRERIAALQQRIAWRTAEATDLLTRERRPAAAVRRRERMRETTVRAWHAYRAPPYGGVVTLIRSEEFHVQPQLERWHALDTAGVVERHVRGTHRSMMREPDVAALADCLRELLDERAAEEHKSSQALAALSPY